MKVDKQKFDALLGRLMSTPPQPAKTIKTEGKAGKIVPAIPRNQLPIRHRLNSEHPLQCRLKPVVCFPPIESRLELAQVAMEMLYRNLVEAAYHAALEERERGLDAVGRSIAIHPNLCAVIDGPVLVEVMP